MKLLLKFNLLTFKVNDEETLFSFTLISCFHLYTILILRMIKNENIFYYITMNIMN